MLRKPNLKRRKVKIWSKLSKSDFELNNRGNNNKTVYQLLKLII